MIMPKCTGSTPNFMTTGNRIGVVIRIEGAISTRHPSTSSRTLISIRITYLLLDNVRKKAVIFAGICMSAIMYPTAAAQAISIMTIATVRSVR